MAAPEGNEYYKLRTKSGRDKIYKTTNALAKACNEYFEWCQKNPLLESDILKQHVNGEGEKLVNVSIPKMRPFTIHGLCNFLDIALSTFQEYEKREGFSVITTRVRQIIYAQKFEGAAAGFLNANIIARDLGLVEKKELDVKEVKPTKFEVIKAKDGGNG